MMSYTEIIPSLPVSIDDLDFAAFGLLHAGT
jgi:hypothetical protein